MTRLLATKIQPSAWSAPPAAPKRDPWTRTRGPMHADVVNRTLTMHGRPVDLPHRESDVLFVLLERIGRGVSGQTLHDEVWGESAPSSNALAVCVGGLRRRLLALGLPLRIETVTGFGYRLEYA